MGSFGILSESIGSTSSSLRGRVKGRDQDAWRRPAHLYGPLADPFRRGQKGPTAAGGTEAGRRKEQVQEPTENSGAVEKEALKTLRQRGMDLIGAELEPNRPPAQGSPKESGGNTGGGILSHRGVEGWNEFLLKLAVPAARTTPAEFQLRFRRSLDPFERPIEQPLSSTMIEPPAAAPVRSSQLLLGR